MSVLECIVRVGKSSNIKLHGISAHRALNMEDIQYILGDARNSISFVVFEETKPGEVEQLRNISGGIKIYAKESIEGLSEIQDIETYNCIEDLQDKVSICYNINARTYKKVEKFEEKLDSDISLEIDDLEKSGDDIESSKEIDLASLFSDSSSESNGYSGQDEYGENEDYTSEDDSDDLQIEDIFSAESLSGIESALTAKVDYYEQLLQSLTTSEDIIDLGYYKEKLKQLRTLTVENREFARQLEEKNEELAELKGIAEKLDELQSKYEKDIAEITSQKDSMESQLSGDIRVSTEEHEKAIGELKERIASLSQLEVTNAEYSKTISELNSSLESISDELTKERARISSLEQKNRELSLNKEQSEEVKSLQQSLKLEIGSRVRILGLLERLSKKYSDLEISFKLRDREIEKVSGSYKVLAKEKSSLELKLEEANDSLQKAQRLRAEQERTAELKADDFEKTIVDLKDEISKLNQDNMDISFKLSETESKLEEIKYTVDSYKHRAEDAESKYKSSQAILETSEAIEAKLRSQLEAEKSKNRDSSELKEELDSIKISNSGLIAEIGRLKINVNELNRICEEKDRTIGRIEQEKSKLETTSRALSKNVTAGDRLDIECKASNKAFIIPVYGSGSYGITTTAVSIAKKLNGNVLLLDFDVTNPKVNAWLPNGIKPIINDLPDMDKTLQKSGFGALIFKGSSYVIEHRNILIQNVAMNRKTNKVLDYFSGLYDKADLYKFAAVDFSEFINFFGNEYDYIVADLGRLGGNEISSALIRLFNRISWRNVCVCLPERNDIRNVFVKIKNEELDSKKMIWLLNMADSTKLDPDLKKMINDVTHYTIMPRDESLFGKMKTFDNVLFMKSRMDELIEHIIS